MGVTPLRTGPRLSSWLLALLGVFAGAPRAGAAEGGELIGQAARPWRAAHWINSAPLELSQLRGRVVLVRFWTAPACPFCSASAPALNDFHARYAARGLTVIGLYHHKGRGALEPADVAHYAETFGFRFPVAIDLDWRTLRDWWLNVDRGFTSSSFLIDKRGIIRYVHPGGQYVRGDADFTRLEAMIERLL
jgi:peroxiredoxin